MKKLSTIFLLFFWVATASILTAGLVFYQNKKDAETPLDPAVAGESQSADSNDGTEAQQNTTTLSPAEVAKHSSQSDCWMIISGKVYNLTKYLTSHPGGVASMIPYCGKDATSAFNNQPHSQNARNLLGNYYLGGLNSQLSTTIAQTPKPTTPKTAQTSAPSVQKPPASVPPQQPPVVNPQLQQTGTILNTAEVAKHSSSSDCWMIVSSKVYNVTSYIPYHPGGAGAITGYCGKDATSAFSNLPHSQNAANLLGSYYVGDLNSQTSPPSSGQQPSTQPTTSSPSPQQPSPSRRSGDDDDD